MKQQKKQPKPDIVRKKGVWKEITVFKESYMKNFV